MLAYNSVCCKSLLTTIYPFYQVEGWLAFMIPLNWWNSYGPSGLLGKVLNDICYVFSVNYSILYCNALKNDHQMMIYNIW